MRIKPFIIILVAAFCFNNVYAQRSRIKPFDSDVLVGNWTGTWNGDTTGKFVMKITKDSEGKLSGRINASSDTGEAFDIYFEPTVAKGNKITAKFEDPFDEREVSIEALLEGSTLKGAYTIRQKGRGRKLEDGKLKATKSDPRPL